MPPISHWIGQFLLAACTMFGLLVAVDILRGTTFNEAWVSALIWAITASVIFIGSRYRQARKGIECGLCNDLPPKK